MDENYQQHARNQHTPGAQRFSGVHSSFKPPLSPQASGLSAVRFPTHSGVSESGNARNAQQILRARTLDTLALEIEALTAEINEAAVLLLQATDREKFDYVTEKERVLGELSKQLDINAIGTASHTQVQVCEHLLIQAQKALRKITNSDDMSAEVEKLVNREQRLRELQRESITHAKSGQSPAQRNVEHIRQKEEKFDRDFARLMERYNHSKELVENMFAQGIGQQGQTLQRSIRHSPHKSEDYLLQPGTTRASATRHAAFAPNTRSQTGQDDPYQQVTSVRHSKESVRTPADGPLPTTHSREKNVTRSLKRLKQTISMKENLEKDKLEKQIHLTKDLKQTLRDYVQRTQELEEGLKLKDELLNKYESEIKNAQEDLLINIDRIKEMKIKEEGWLKLEDELREVNLALKGKAARKKQKIKLLREQNFDLSKALEELRDAHESDSQRLRTALEDLNQQTCNKEDKIHDLEQLIKSLKDAEQAKGIEAQHHIHNLESKIEELKDVQAQLEAKIAKNKVKFEEEKKILTEEKIQEVSKKKDKLGALKRQNEENAERIVKLEREILQTRQQFENTHSHLTETEKFCDEQRAENKRLVQELTHAKGSIANLQQESDRLQHTISKLEDKDRQGQKILEQEQLSQNQVKVELMEANGQNAALHDKVQRLEQQIEFLHKQQDAEISQIDAKIDSFIAEIKQLKDENTDLKQREVQLRRQLSQTEELQNNFKEKYLKAKNSNKSLREHLKEVEDKVKDYMHERSIEVREQEKVREQARASDMSTKNKLRLLDEIQGMIRQHKQHAASSCKYE